MNAPRIHCQTYRQLAALKIVLDALGKKLASKEQERATPDAPASAGGDA